MKQFSLTQPCETSRHVGLASYIEPEFYLHAIDFYAFCLRVRRLKTEECPLAASHRSFLTIRNVVFLILFPKKISVPGMFRFFQTDVLLFIVAN